ncbi:hypothetical protein HX836_12070 [Pseudomonas yamanorum]|uniref:hypothetical protein n=1 Tax=Pseudomonas yamanorum TaxID=515393 RepID=UPI0015A0C01F|nr:hypothetical protein [Pseudomonas yamanorum]NVZ82538.1 hypothetical protein [Pseudomonas yamanorum]
MDSFHPLNFFQASAGVFGAFALIFGLLSLFDGLRTHAIRMLAIFLVVALSLFANSTTVYFAAVFIIATAVTELEFLQTLAAIIRGNKDYFTFRKETLSSEAKYKSSQAELIELEVVSEVKADSDQKTDKVDAQDVTDNTHSVPFESHFDEEKNSSTNERAESTSESSKLNASTTSSVESHVAENVEKSVPVVGSVVGAWRKASKEIYRVQVERAIELEKRALNFMQGLYGSLIERNVVFQSSIHRLELDGLITRPGVAGYVDQIFEVKYIGAPSRVHALLTQLQQVSLKSSLYFQMTNRTAMVQLVVILDSEEDLPEHETDLLRAGTHKWGIEGFYVVNLKVLKGF